MDFFHSQDVARRKSFLLLSYFVLALLTMIVGLYAVVLIALGAGTPEDLLREGALRWWNPPVLAGVTLGVLSVVFLGTLYKTWELRGGGEALASSLGGRRLSPETTDLSERRLLNVVEEMALASGVPVPPVFRPGQRTGHQCVCCRIHAGGRGHRCEPRERWTTFRGMSCRESSRTSSVTFSTATCG